MDETNGRQASAAPSSSSSDLYATDAPAPEPTALASAALPTPEEDAPDTVMDGHDDADDEDSSSEMDVSASSRSTSAEPETQEAHHGRPKRKLSDPIEENNGTSLMHPQDSVKKRRLSTPPEQDVSTTVSRSGTLPVELWQQVFLYLPPAMLSRCLRVSRAFNSYLTSTKAGPAAKKGQSKVRVLDSETIWTHARKTFFPNLPRPLVRCSELEMLQLVGGKRCQFCDREPVPSPCTTPFNSGPGPDGLRVIWPFGIRSCGRCIENNTLKDVQILVSQASSLRFGLPYIFLTPDFNFVPEVQRQAPGGIPSHLRVAKVYYTKDIQTIVSEFEDAKSLGDGAADEWRKGLHTKGRDAMTDASRWEKWEGQLRLGSDLSQVLREYDLTSFSQHTQEAPSKLAGVSGPASVTQTAATVNGPHPLPPIPVQAFQNGYSQPYSNLLYQQAHRPVRDPHEVEAIRQARKADIERRCMELEPPLELNVLQHMEAFQASMQITQPMNEASWQILKPRLLAGREAAEEVEHQRQEQWAALQATVPFTPAEEAFMKPAKEVYDKEYEHAQEPLRKKLGEYVDEYTHQQWNLSERSLDRDNCPTFAVETMLYVRQRYVQDKEAGLFPSVEPPVKAGSKQGTPIPEPFLSLDNMKWVFDNKIRILTDNHRRELFICAGCAEERKPKWFAFEGLIQHYGAKHTTAFSKGNIVVHWQTSEWPEDPPFHQNPSQWIKADRRTSDLKAHGRTRNTPQANHDGPFAPPGKLLSESPYFSSHAQQPLPASNVYQSVSAGYTPYQYGLSSPHVAHYGHPYLATAPTEPSVDMSEQARINKLSTDAREIWDAMDGVKELLECVRIQTVIQHVVARFVERFRQKPSVDTVTDALATNSNMRSIKNANGLACKICVAGQTDGSADYQSYFARIRNVKLYNASSLITHFKIVHQPQENTGYPDWTKDMIELPETQIITDLMYTPGMDDDKLAIVGQAFPHAFPTPLPKIGLVQQQPSRDMGPDSGLASRLVNRLNKKPKQPPKKKGHLSVTGNGTPGREVSQEPLPEPKDDEYDPRRPMYLGSQNQAADPARFDTDIARKASTSSPMRIDATTFNLAPETLLALNNLSALTAQSQKSQGDDRRDRSPSVGHTESHRSPSKPAEDKLKGQPDITAILSALTGQPQPAHPVTPTATISNRSDSAPKYPPADPYGRPHDGTHGSTYEESRPSTRYVQSAYGSSVEPPVRYDAQASMSHNNTRYEQNRAQASYVEPPYAASHSPPRYRYVYNDGQAYAQQPPVYREQPVQYIQVSPDHDRPPVTAYQYERPAPVPKPTYVDEYGRPIQLIPIDSAPAPIQYMPHPYAQQLQQQQQQQQQYVRVQEPAPAPQARTHVAQPVYDERRNLYYEQSGPPPSAGHPY